MVHLAGDLADIALDSKLLRHIQVSSFGRKNCKIR